MVDALVTFGLADGHVFVITAERGRVEKNWGDDYPKDGYRSHSRPVCAKKY